METTALSNSSKKFFFVFAALILLTFFGNGYSQSQVIGDLTKQKGAKANLEMGIQSENIGVRESTIYFTGKYRLIEMEDELIAQLQVEKDSDIRVLIGLALFRMGSEKGMETLADTKSTDSNPRVRRMFASIYNEYQINNASGKTAGR